MKIKKLLTAVGVVLLTSTAIQTVQAAEDGYAEDASGTAVTASDGSCVRSAVGAILKECIPAAAPITIPPPPVVVIPPPPPVVVAPMPKPLPPIVKVLSLNETGGSNFAFDKATLQPSAIDRLTTFSSEVKSSGVAPNTITITGHTDSVGSDAYNQTLSERRANSVAEFLASQGLNRAKMQVSGRGESQPVASNKTKAGRAQNRRVDINVSGQRKVIIRR